jgi:hypothetical protein
MHTILLTIHVFADTAEDAVGHATDIVKYGAAVVGVDEDERCKNSDNSAPFLLSWELAALSDDTATAMNKHHRAP